MAGTFQNYLERFPLFWRLQIMGWGGFMIYGYFSRASFWNEPVLAILLTLILEPTSLLISTGLRFIYIRLELRRGFNLRTLGGVFVLSGLAGALQVLVSIGAHDFASMVTGLVGQGDSRYIARVIFYWMVFGAWSFAYLWLKAEISVRSEKEQREAAAAAAQRAELHMLRLQLNPHFMFNALNNIASEIPEQPGMALEMTHQLAEYLRYSMDHRGDLIVPLSHELEGMKTYLAIEQGRFGSRLQVCVDDDPDTQGVKVPSFLLQPLVENAVKHGLNTSEPPWELGVKVWMEKARLRISVTNTGKLDNDWRSKNTTGTGVTNLERRLTLHYPGRHLFKLWQQESIVVADMTLEGEPCQV